MDSACIFQQEEADLFFDSRDSISSFSDSCLGSPSGHDSLCKENSSSWLSNDSQYKVWITSPRSIQERRAKFMRWMDADSRQSPCGAPTIPDIDRITSDAGAVLMSSNGSISTSESCSTCSWSPDEPSTSVDDASEDRFEFMIKNLDDGMVFVADQFSDDGTPKCLHEVASNRSMTLDEFEKSFGPSSLVQRLMQKEDSRLNDRNMVFRRSNSKWLQRLGAVTCIVDKQSVEIDSQNSFTSRIQRVKVRSHSKKCKEFSAVYMGQDIQAHDGAIITMKFSPDGEYLASAGEDGVVRVWRVMECERRNEGDIPEEDPSCIYFKVNYNSELSPLFVQKEKLKLRGMKKTPDSACVVIPPVMFRISEKPVHEFYGHDGDVLDLSWSKDKYLLSSSIDKTARLWKVGCDGCLKIFLHKNYVTSVEFNPVAENYFVSGSLDGKVRVWDISEHRVVDWTDVREIVTALCYRPDGKGLIVGTINGHCRFYDTSDHQMTLDAQIALRSKKKTSDKRITGFQYCPGDHRKLMVTSADSHIWILDGHDVISKYKGLHNARSQISASFTSDGKHIVSASEDSNVYVWSHGNNDSPSKSQVKSSRSYERFISSHASVAIPWPRPTPMNLASEVLNENCTNSSGDNTVYLSPAGSFTLGSEFMPKGTATWPEEVLPSCSPPVSTPALEKSQYKFLKCSCQNSSHAWGEVIVTAGFDGRIRSFQNYGLPVN